MKLNPLGPVAGSYYLDDSEVAVIMGPVGSGKTDASCLRLARHAMTQRPDPDGVRRSRWAVVRNTGPQLRDTTIKSWLNLFPENQYGRLVGNPATQKWNFTPKGEKHRVEAEFLFRALDDAGDVRNLLSLQVNGFYFNEVSEIAPEILQHAGRRAGRGLPVCTWHGWIADSNPWDMEAYLHEILVLNPREGHKFFKQPGGMDPDAENLENLMQTEETHLLPWNDERRREQGRTYYINALRDYSPADADRYVHCKYGASRDGKPVFVSYNDNAHCKSVTLDALVPLEVGYDCSGRNPAAIVGQKQRTGQWRIAAEFCGEDLSMIEHVARFKRFIVEKFPKHRVGKITVDPSGAPKDAHDIDMIRVIRKEFPGVLVLKALTNDPKTRIEAVDGAFRRMVNGEPAIIIDPACKVLRQACISKYQYRKLKLTGGNQYADVPDKKHPWSDAADGLEYLMVGAGEARNAMGDGANDFGGNAITPQKTWDVFRV